ncbi:MAG: type III polyketide synthase, partial [Brachybacterium tyrofermentans]
MTVTLRSLELAVPGTELAQEELRDVFLAQPCLSRLGTRLVSSAFDNSGIERRYSALTEWGEDAADEDAVFFDATTHAFLNPTTGARNQVFSREATELYVTTAAAALEACEGLVAADVTHVITVSCTGFFAPGPDYRIVRALGLDPSVQRYHLGFMGCYAAFPALRQAQIICRADPDAVVLVVTVELCTLHVRTSNDPGTIVGS